jgi:hypothetical protein
LLGLVSFIIICLHRFIPKKLWTRVDIFSMEHSTKEGESVVKRRTQLGSAFTVAFLPVTIMVLVGLAVSNSPNELSSLQASNSQPAIVGHLTVNLSFPLAASSHTTCKGMPTHTGLTCGKISFDQKTCMLMGTSCSIGLDAVITFSVPWNQRWVGWSVATETTQKGQMKAVSGHVACATPSLVMRGETRVVVQAMASYRNDTTLGPSGITTGYELYPLPLDPPVTGRSNETDFDAWSGKSTIDDWTLALALQRAPLVQMAKISPSLSPFQLLSLSLTTVGSFLGIWRIGFGTTEKVLARAEKKAKRGSGKESVGERKGGGADESETKIDGDDGMEMQAVDVRRAASSSSVANPAYDPTSHMSTSIERIANLEIELAQERDHMAQERARAQEREDRIIARVVELERGQRGARS